MLEATSELNWAEHTGVIDVRKDYTSRFDNGLTVWHMSENVGEHIQTMSRRTLGTTLDVLINWKNTERGILEVSKNRNLAQIHRWKDRCFYTRLVGHNMTICKWISGLNQESYLVFKSWRSARQGQKYKSCFQLKFSPTEVGPTEVCHPKRRIPRLSVKADQGGFEPLTSSHPKSQIQKKSNPKSNFFGGILDHYIAVLLVKAPELDFEFWVLRFWRFGFGFWTLECHVAVRLVQILDFWDAFWTLQKI